MHSDSARKQWTCPRCGLTWDDPVPRFASIMGPVCGSCQDQVIMLMEQTPESMLDDLQKMALRAATVGKIEMTLCQDMTKGLMAVKERLLLEVLRIT